MINRINTQNINFVESDKATKKEKARVEERMC